MNDKTAIQPRPSPGLRTAVCWALVLSSMISTPVLSAQTDISTSPITSTNAAQVKPNIMLLMDTSGSMGWGHMPDEVETQVGIGSIGYKAAQCNALYYNRNQTYAIPKLASGLLFPTPSFHSASYDPFDITSFTMVDLSSAFKAYDDQTLRTSGYNDTPQPAYYYYKTGGSVPITAYNSSPCTDGDVNMTVPSSDGGSWNRVVVNSGSGVGGADERQNFSIWYSYYRTRILLTKSAASLAFTPLTDSFRVGFITVKPKDSPTDAAINPDKYLAINDFTTVQRGLWFDKLFAQKPSGSSPTREGLARVGRHYAGMHDGINQGMPEDPVQFSCQQNFTIMTTDGYWNAQDESTGLGGSYLGGPVDMSGKALVGQRDGTLNALTTNNPSPPPAADFNGTPRPIWDGTFDGLRTVRSKTIHNEYEPCGTYFNMSTSQLSISTSQLLKTTSQTTMSTTQLLQSTSQNLQSTLQTLKATSQPTQSTFQTLKRTHQILQSSTQRLASTTQTTQRTLQNLAATSQNRASTFQNLMATDQFFAVVTHSEQSVFVAHQSTNQVLQSTSQLLKSTAQLNQQTTQSLQSTQQNFFTFSYTTQNTSQTTQATSQTLQHTAQILKSTSQMLQHTEQTTETDSQISSSTLRLDQSTSQIQLTTSQVWRSTSQLRSCDARGENCVPGPVGSCVQTAFVTCDTVTTGPTLRDTCADDPASRSNNWKATTCDVRANPYVAAPSCTPDSANGGNGHTTITCFTATTGPTAVAFCTPFPAVSGNAYTATTCNPVATAPVFAPSCTPSPPNAGNGFVATMCAPSSVGPTGVQTCTPQSPTLGNNFLTVVCNPNNTADAGVASCTGVPAGSGNSWTATVCTPVVTTNVPASACTNSGPTAGNGYTTTSCSNNNSVDTGVPSCVNDPASSGNSWTATVCTPVNTSNPSGGCVTDGPTLGNGYTTTSCPVVNSGPTIVNAAACTAAPGGSGNSWTTTTCTPTVSGPNPFAGACFADFSVDVNSYHCSSNNTTDVAVASCSPSGPSVGNGYTTTTCRSNDSAQTPVAACTPVTADNTNMYTATICPVVTTTDVGSATCTTDSTPTPGNVYTTTSLSLIHI